MKTRKFWIVGRSGRCAQWGCLSRRSSRAPFVFTMKRAPGAAACAFFPLRKERGHRDFSLSFSFLQKKGRQNYPHSTKQCRRFSETRVCVVSRLSLSLIERGGGERIATWLILPVVICLSQRLSHACLSITFILGNCEWLIKSVIVYLMVLYSDNRRNSRANTCVRPDFWKGCIY